MTDEWNWVRTPDGGWHSGPPNGHGTYVLPEVELPDGYTPPSASMNPDAVVEDWELSRCVHCGDTDCTCPEPDGSEG